MHRRNRINLVVFLSFLAIWGLGIHGFVVSQNDDCCRPTVIASAAYKSLQMFGLNFDLEPPKKATSKTESEKSPSKAEAASGAAEEKVVEPTLEAARFLAAGFSASTAILLISRPMRTALQILLQIAWFWRPRVIIFGYGPVGRAIARRFRTSRTVTVVDIDPDGTKRTAADGGVLFVEGDGSDPAIIRKVRTGRSRTVFVAYDDDMTSLDVAKAVVATQTASKSVAERLDVRVILESRSLARDLVASRLSQLDALDRVSIFDLPEMAAIRLCETARFDRVALEAEQPRTHVVLIGCGDLGDAVLIEVLLTAWRIGLEPPKVTVVDPRADIVRARIRALSPALFILPGEPGALPEAALPQIVFENLDLTSANAATEVARLSPSNDPVTAIVIATGRDALNLEIGMALERAMSRGEIEISPIHFRLSNEYQGETPDIGTARIGLLSPFGSLESIVEYGRAFADDPDFVARRIHDLYRSAKKKVVPGQDEPLWNDLKATLKASNRRLYRHAVQKLEDLGLQVRTSSLDRLRVSAELAERIERARLEIEDRYARIEDRGDHRPIGPITFLERIERSAVLEHERWMTERAIDGWRAAASSKQSDRDDTRRLHNYICDWKQVDEVARRYDTLLLWALTTIDKGDDPHIYERRVGRVWLSLDPGDRSETWITTTNFDISETPPTDLEVAIARPDFTGSESRALAATAAAQLARFVESSDVAARLVRIRLLLDTSCDEELLRIVGAIVARLSRSSWEVATTWRRRAARPLRIGFAGHRDLARIGGASKARQAVERTFVDLAFSDPNAELICGFAPGADQLAVTVWKRMGLRRPQIVIPYAVQSAVGVPEYWTDEPHSDGAAHFTAEALRDIADFSAARREGGESGHVAQARRILERATLLAALWDGTTIEAPGGTADTVALAKARGLPVLVVSP